MVQRLSPWAILAPGWGKFFLLGFALSAEGVDRNLFEPVKSFLPLFLRHSGIKSEKSLQKSTKHVL